MTYLLFDLDTLKHYVYNIFYKEFKRV